MGLTPIGGNGRILEVRSVYDEDEVNKMLGEGWEFHTAVGGVQPVSEKSLEYQGMPGFRPKVIARFVMVRREEQEPGELHAFS